MFVFTFIFAHFLANTPKKPAKLLLFFDITKLFDKNMHFYGPKKQNIHYSGLFLLLKFGYLKKK